MTMERVGQQDTETTSMRLVGALQKIAGSVACVDGNGLGIGVVNRVRSFRLPVLSYIGSQKAEGIVDVTGEFKFANTRSAAYWHLRELLDPVNGPGDIAIPRDEDLAADLTVPRWKVKLGGVIAVEPKDQVVKRLKRSPDCGDAVVMTFWPDSSAEARSRIVEYSSTHDDIDSWASDVVRPLAARRPGHRRRIEELGRGQLTLRGDTHMNVHTYSEIDGGWDTEW
jgi:hypothetical protein